MIGKGISEGASKKNLLFGDVLGHSFFLKKHAMFLIQLIKVLVFAGMKVLYKTFPEGILSGEVPASCQTTPLRSSRTRNATEFPVGSGYRPDTKGHKKYFTVEDLETVQHKLDDALLSSKNGRSLKSVLSFPVCL